LESLGEMRFWKVVLASVPALFLVLMYFAVTNGLRTTYVFGPLPDKAAASKAACTAINEYVLFDDDYNCSNLEAYLDGDVWIVGITIPPGVHMTGAPYVRLSKFDGRLLETHFTP